MTRRREAGVYLSRWLGTVTDTVVAGDAAQLYACMDKQLAAARV